VENPSSGPAGHLLPQGEKEAGGRSQFARCIKRKMCADASPLSPPKGGAQAFFVSFPSSSTSSPVSATARSTSATPTTSTDKKSWAPPFGGESEKGDRDTPIPFPSALARRSGGRGSLTSPSAGPPASCRPFSSTTRGKACRPPPRQIARLASLRFHLFFCTAFDRRGGAFRARQYFARGARCMARGQAGARGGFRAEIQRGISIRSGRLPGQPARAPR
jgi:hypothetical protein